ncbi:MAG: hypothetical protein ABIR34_12865 [Marmoricola sp.]
MARISAAAYAGFCNCPPGPVTRPEASRMFGASLARYAGVPGAGAGSAANANAGTSAEATARPDAKAMDERSE